MCSKAQRQGTSYVLDYFAWMYLHGPVRVEWPKFTQTSSPSLSRLLTHEEENTEFIFHSLKYLLRDFCMPNNCSRITAMSKIEKQVPALIANSSGSR